MRIAGSRMASGCIFILACASVPLLAETLDSAPPPATVSLDASQRPLDAYFCELPAPGDSCTDGLTSIDDRLLNDPDVHHGILTMWRLSKPASLHRDRQEAGFVVVRLAEGSVTAGAVRTDGDPHRVELVLPSAAGDAVDGELVATFHSHPLGGEVNVDLRALTSRYWIPCHSPRDMEGAHQTQALSYVLTGRGLYRFDPGSDEAPALVLCGPRLAAYLRAPSSAQPGRGHRADRRAAEGTHSFRPRPIL